MQNMIANNDIDLVIFFHSADLEQDAESMNLAEISRLCDMYNIPLATNITHEPSLNCVCEVIWSGERLQIKQLCRQNAALRLHSFVFNKFNLKLKNR